MSEPPTDGEYRDVPAATQGFMMNLRDALSAIHRRVCPPPSTIDSYVDTSFISRKLRDGTNEEDFSVLENWAKLEVEQLRANYEALLSECPGEMSRLFALPSFELVDIGTIAASPPDSSSSPGARDNAHALEWLRLRVNHTSAKPFLSRETLERVLSARCLAEIIGENAVQGICPGDVIHYPFYRREHCLFVYILRQYPDALTQLDIWCQLFAGRTGGDLRRYASFLWELHALHDNVVAAARLAQQSTLVVVPCPVFPNSYSSQSLRVIPASFSSQRPFSASVVQLMREQMVDAAPRRKSSSTMSEIVAAAKCGSLRCSSASVAFNYLPWVARDPQKNRNRVALCSADKDADSMNALIIDLDSGSLAYCEGHRAQVNDIQWSSDGSFVFTAGNDGNIGAFRDNGSCVAFATCHFNRVALLATHLSDPHVFVSAGGDETLKLWRLNNENGTIEWHDDLLLPAPRYVEPYLRDAASVRDDHPRFRTSHAVLFSRWRSELLISGTQVEKHGCLDLYDVNCSTRLLRLWAHADMISCVDQNACDPWIVATGGETDNYVRVFDLRTGKRVSDLIDSREKDRPHATINFVQFSPTAPHIVAACRTDCVVEVYDSRKSSCPVHVFRHEKSSLRTRPQSRAGEYTGANHARFSPCGRFLFSCGEDSGVRVWSLTGVHCDNLAYLQTPPQLIAESSALVVGHEGDYVLACSDNGFVHLWSVPGTDYKLPAGRVNNVLF